MGFDPKPQKGRQGAGSVRARLSLARWLKDWRILPDPRQLWLACQHDRAGSTSHPALYCGGELGPQSKKMQA